MYRRYQVILENIEFEAKNNVGSLTRFSTVVNADSITNAYLACVEKLEKFTERSVDGSVIVSVKKL